MQRVKSILKNNIILYNQFLTRNKIKLENFNISSFSETNDTYFVSNNNNKYYCLIINEETLGTSNKFV